jgi:hypothetical protein
MFPGFIAFAVATLGEFGPSLAAEIGKKKTLSFLEEQGEPIINHHLARALVRALADSLIERLNAWGETPEGKQNRAYASFAIQQLQVISEETKEKNTDWTSILKNLNSSVLNEALETVRVRYEQPIQASDLGKKAMGSLRNIFSDPEKNEKALNNFCDFLSKEETVFNFYLYERFREEIKEDSVTFNAFTIDFLSQIYTDVKKALPNAKALDSWIYVDGSRPVIDLERIFGREKELESIENILNDKSALVITGLRGTGKSTLASMFITRMEKSGKFDGIYWRKVVETTTISDIIGSFFIVIGKPVKELERYKIPDQISLLLKELKEAPFLLVLDNFEILLDPQTNKPLESKVGFSELIEISKDNCFQSKILFTCWDSLASERGFRPFPYRIMGLDTSAGISLLKREGLNEPENELRKAVEMSGGHPLALF